MTSIRQLAISLMRQDQPQEEHSEENSISTISWTLLEQMLEQEGGNEDVIEAVKSTEGRYYLRGDDWEQA